MAVAHQLILGEINQHPYNRQEDIADHPDYHGLKHNYARSLKLHYARVVRYGYVTPLPAGTVYHSTVDNGGRVLEMSLLNGRLKELELEASDAAPFEETRLKSRVTSERKRLYGMRTAAAERVRHGRPWHDSHEASRYGKPRKVWTPEAGWTQKPYPPLSDAELLGHAEYTKLIAERVTEARRAPNATTRDIYLAENPHMLPLAPETKLHQGKSKLMPTEGCSETLSNCDLGIRVMNAALLSATVTWGLKAGKRPAHVPTSLQLAESMLDLVIHNEVDVDSTLGDHLKTLERGYAVELLRDRVAYYRRKYGFSQTLNAERKQRLQHFQKMMPTLLPPTPPNASLPLAAQAQWGAETWLKQAWPFLKTFFETHPTYQL
tara:strand:- start:2626 stop:3756 length:1131 start_codon:yes stop_codon:yes gene_type:complete